MAEYLIYLAQAIGWLMVLDGAVFLVEPTWIRPVVKFLVKGRILKITAAARTVGGIILFISAGQGRIPWLMILGGIMLIIAGMPGIIIDIDAQRKIMLESSEESPAIVRASSAVVLALGIGIVFGSQV